MTPRPDVSMTPAEITAFLDAPRTAVLSTLGNDGIPHMAAMWFVRCDGAIQMWTYAKSQKAVNLRRDPRAAVLIEDGIAYDELKGIVIRGIVELIEGFDAIASIGRSLYIRYTLPLTGVSLDLALPEIERQARKRVGISLALDDVASWDHSKL